MSSIPTSSADPSAKRTFLANLRHELRTPLNAIIGYSEMIQEEVADAAPHAARALQQIRAGGNTLLALVNSILDASKITEGEFAGYAQALCQQLSAPLREVMTCTRGLTEDAEAAGVGAFLDDLGKIREAAERLHRELADLEGRSQRRDSAPDRADPLTPGMQGYLEFMRPGAAAPVRPDTQAGRILVVDDVEMNRDVLARRLRSQGHHVALASSGPEALTLVRAEPFDLILLDILMPEVNGLQVLQELKRDPSLQHLPVVMISALDEMDSIIRSIEMGAEDYLPKPFEPAILRARVGACLEKKRLRDREVEYREQIEAERNRADGLLHVILPAEVVKELKDTNAVRPRRYENVAIMFCDIVGFTPYCDKRQPEEIVANLQQMVIEFEEFSRAHRIQKIKTIGDSYMAACGLLQAVENPVLECVRCGVRMIEAARRLPANWEVRIGIHVGSVVAGVLGHHQYLFDLWGDTVNTAARMESNGVPGAITLSEEAYQAVQQICRCDCLGTANIKGKGQLQRFVFREFLP